MSIVGGDGLKPINGRWPLMFAVNIGIAVLCGINAAWWSLGVASLINAAFAGFAASSALHAVMMMRREVSYNAMVKTFNAMKALNDRVMEEWSKRRYAEFTATAETAKFHPTEGKDSTLH